MAASPAGTKSQSGPIVEVVVIGETIIYCETTRPVKPLSVENQTIYQAVEPAMLNDLDERSRARFWRIARIVPEVQRRIIYE